MSAKRSPTPIPIKVGDVLKYCKISDQATAPTRFNNAAAGLDLYSAYDHDVIAGGKVVCFTDLKVQLPEGTYGRLAAKSKMSSRHSLEVGAGVIDPDFRGNIGIIVYNHGDEDLKIKQGDCIAQLICEKFTSPEIVEVEEMSEDTGRGVRGVKFDHDYPRTPPLEAGS